MINRIYHRAFACIKLSKPRILSLSLARLINSIKMLLKILLCLNDVHICIALLILPNFSLTNLQVSTYTCIYSAINVHLSILYLIHIMRDPENSVRGVGPDNVVCFTQTDTDPNIKGSRGGDSWSGPPLKNHKNIVF